MSNKYAIVGAGPGISSSLMLQVIKEKFGEDIILITPEEAQEKKVLLDDIVNLPVIKITATPELKEQHQFDVVSSKEKRRARRERERKKRK